MSSEPEEKSDERMDRGAFFKQGFRSLAKTAFSAVEKKVEKTVKRKVIRPPYAVTEAAFLALCTTGSCVKCLEACPHGAIVLTMMDGNLAGIPTPKIDLSKSPCYVCEDFPCVEVCPTGALQPEDGKAPKMGKVSLKDGCHRRDGKDPFCEYCVERCPLPGAISMDDLKGPVLDHEKCVGCGVCEYCCPARPSALKVSPV